MEAWIMILAIAVFGGVIGKLLYELNPVAWKNAAANVEDDTPPDGAIDDDPAAERVVYPSIGKFASDRIAARRTPFWP